MFYMTNKSLAGIHITPIVTSADQEKTIWHVAPRINSVKGHTLKCGDIIKLGKTILKVLQVSLNFVVLSKQPHRLRLAPV